MVAVPLLLGDLQAEHYENDFHAIHPQIDILRDKMEVVEEERFTREYLEADKRSIANAIQIFFKDGSHTEKVEVEYPIGHRRRRQEGIPVLKNKFLASLRSRLPEGRCQQIMAIYQDTDKLAQTPVNEFMELFVIN